MPQNHRPPRPEVIDIAIAVSVEKISALRAGNERRLAANRTEAADRGVDAAREEAFGARLQSMGLVTNGHVDLQYREVGWPVAGRIEVSGLCMQAAIPSLILKALPCLKLPRNPVQNKLLPRLFPLLKNL